MVRVCRRQERDWPERQRIARPADSFARAPYLAGTPGSAWSGFRLLRPGVWIACATWSGDCVPAATAKASYDIISVTIKTSVYGCLFAQHALLDATPFPAPLNEPITRFVVSIRRAVPSSALMQTTRKFMSCSRDFGKGCCLRIIVRSTPDASALRVLKEKA